MDDDLPVGWQVTTIGDVTLPVEKIDPSKNPTHEIIYLDISGIDNKSNKIVEVKSYLGKDAPSRARQLVQVDDVLFSTVRTYLKNIAVVPAQYDGQVASTGFSVLRAANGISGNFLFHFSLTAGFLDQLADLQRGSSYPAVRDIDVRVQKIPLPPTNEQKRIVDKIEQLFSNLDEGESLLKKVQQQLYIYRQSVLKSAVTGELTGCSDNKWKEYNIGQLLTDIRYGTAKKCSFDPSKTPVLRIPNVAGGKIDLSDLKHTDFTDTELQKLRLIKGDILLVRSNGSASLVGLSAIVTESATGYAYAGYLIRLRIKNDLILPEFLNCYLHSPLVRSRIEREARSTSGVHNINSDEVRSITLRLPSLQEQENIVNSVDSIFSHIDALEQWCASELTRSVTLRQSILKDAFSGKLVPQDPTDEPASELLKRIQAERSNAPKAAKQKSSTTTSTRRGRPRKNS